MARRTIRTVKTRRKIIAALSAGASVTAAVEASRVARSSLYLWRDEDPDFAREWEEAVEAGTDRLEDEALRRAKEGTLRPVFYEGVQCGQIREFSDTLTIFLLKARRPEKYRDRTSLELAGKDGGPIVFRAYPEDENL